MAGELWTLALYGEVLYKLRTLQDPYTNLYNADRGQISQMTYFADTRDCLHLSEQRKFVRN